MEEVIGFGVIGLLVISLVLGVRKLFKKKRDLFDYEDEIILDKKMLHLGPFSGSFVYPHRKSIILLAVSSSFLSAGLDLRTIDNWGINAYSNENLILHKTSENTESNLYIEMGRPFCICSDPTITAPVGNTNYNEGDRIKATMIVDKDKPKNIVLEVQTILGSGSDSDYALKLLYFPSLRYAKTFDIKFSNASPMKGIHFYIKGMSNAMKQSEKICLSGYELEELEMQETSFI